MAYGDYVAWNSWSPGDTSTSTTSATWGQWVSSDYYFTTSGSSNTVWVSWTSTIASSSITTTDTWYIWQNGSQMQEAYKPHELTPEERQKDEQERIRLAELAKERERKAKEATEKAHKLLVENLTKNQKEVFEATGFIPVECRSGRKYHIRKGISGNVHELDEKGATKSRLCFHPTDCPEYDVMLAQKLMLEVCEEEARKIANFS